MSPQSTHDLELRARSLYRQAAADVDTATAAHLREARRRALDGGHRGAARWMVPAGAFAAAALALVVVWNPLRGPSPHASGHAVRATVDADAELPPDADAADPGLYQDLDFYAWLAEKPGDSRGDRQ